MLIGILQFELLIHGAESLKDKRRVVRSVKDKLHREHLVSVAEVAALDQAGIAIMGLAAVSNSAVKLESTMDRIIHKLRCLHDAELGAHRREVLHGEQLPIEGEATEARDQMLRLKSGLGLVSEGGEGL